MRRRPGRRDPTQDGETTMAGMTETTRDWPRSPWRKALWLGAAALLALPAVAMRFTREVNWDGADFIVMGLLLAATCAAIDFGMRLSGNLAYRAGIAVGVGGGFLLLWVNMAVGILGGEGNPANLMYLGVLIIGMVGAVLARFRAAGLVRTMLAMAVAQVLVAVIAMATGRTGASPWLEVVGVTLFFLGPWLLAAALFRVAQSDASPGSAA
jgi:hypothetical protein